MSHALFHTLKRFCSTRSLLALALALMFAAPGYATLIDRGSGLIYDDVLDITWLQDANLAATNTFGVGGISSGHMNWDTANSWLAAMNADGGTGYLGFSDWRLPTMDILHSGTSTPNFITNCRHFPTECVVTGNELGYMYHQNIGATYSPLGTHIVDGITLINVSDIYWSSTVLETNFGNVFTFNFRQDLQEAQSKSLNFSVWAVRSGDSLVSVPEPTTLTLMSLGLFGLGFNRRKRLQ